MNVGSDNLLQFAGDTILFLEEDSESFVGSLDVKSNMIDDLEKLKNTT